MPRTDDELRSAGWEEHAITEYRRGAEDVRHMFANVTMPGASSPQPDMPAFTAALPRVIATGDRGTWARNTPAGQLRAVVSPDQPEDGAREMAAARAFIDDWEYRYGRRPSMAHARAAVGRRSDGVMLSGTAAEIGRVFAMAGLPFATMTEIKPLPGPGQAVVTSPHRG